MNQPRQPNGSPHGGEWAGAVHADAKDVALISQNQGQSLASALREAVGQAPASEDFKTDDNHPSWSQSVHASTIEDEEFCWRARKLLGASTDTSVEVLESQESWLMYEGGATWEDEESVTLRCGDTSRVFPDLGTAIRRLQLVADDPGVPEHTDWEEATLRPHLHQVRDFVFANGVVFRGELGNYYPNGSQLYISGEWPGKWAAGKQPTGNWDPHTGNPNTVALRPSGRELDRIDPIPGLEDKPEYAPPPDLTEHVGGVTIGDKYDKPETIAFLRPVGQAFADAGMSGTLTDTSVGGLYWEPEGLHVHVFVDHDPESPAVPWTVDFDHRSDDDGLPTLVKTRVRDSLFDASIKEAEGLRAMRWDNDLQLRSQHQSVEVRFDADGKPSFFSAHWKDRGAQMTPGQASHRLSLRGRGAGDRLMISVREARNDADKRAGLER